MRSWLTNIKWERLPQVVVRENVNSGKGYHMKEKMANLKGILNCPCFVLEFINDRESSRARLWKGFGDGGHEKGYGPGAAQKVGHGQAFAGFVHLAGGIIRAQAQGRDAAQGLG